MLINSFSIKAHNEYSTIIPGNETEIMNELKEYPRTISRVTGPQGLTIDTFFPQNSSPASSHFPDSLLDSLRSPIELGLSDSRPHSREHLLPGMSQNCPHTGRLVVMKRNIIRRIPTPIRTALITFRGRTSGRIRQLRSEPFDIAKLIGKKRENLHRLSQFVVESGELLISNSTNINGPSTTDEIRCARTRSQPAMRQAPIASQTRAKTSRSASAGPVLYYRNSSPPRLTIRIPELAAITEHGKTVDPTIQPHLPIRLPTTSEAAQAALSEVHAWKIHAETSRKEHVKLEREMQKVRTDLNQQTTFADHFRRLFERESKKVMMLEKELEQALELIATLELAAQVKVLEKELEDAYVSASASTAEAVKEKKAKRSSSQRSFESMKSWSHSDEAKFKTVVPPSPTVSKIPSIKSTTSESSTESDDRKGWVTAAEILNGSGSEDQSDSESTKRSYSEFKYQTPVELSTEAATPIELSAETESPAELSVEGETSTELSAAFDSPIELSTVSNSPTEPPTAPETSKEAIAVEPSHPIFNSYTSPTTRIDCVGLNSNSAYIEHHPDISRVPLSLDQGTSIPQMTCPFCSRLNMWEWSSVPDVRLRDVVAEEKKNRRSSGRVFQGKELASLKLGTDRA